MLGYPHQQVEEAMWQQCSQVTLHTLQSIQSETPMGNDPPLTGGSRTLQSQAGRQGLRSNSEVSYTILMVKVNTEQQTAAAESQNAAENISGAASAAGSLG